ncbi:MAG: YraN family protein [Gammaproteobacteria bacterium]|nr:YraN family protein [Gammaproteobacteria bacterium]
MERRTTIAAGSAGEQRALEYLRSRGLRLLVRNFRCRLGEIDLVMRDGDVLVFVEVRCRRRNARVSAAESVDLRKQRKLVRAARMFLRLEDRYARWPARFDVVACVLTPRGTGDVHWIPDAFRLD